MNAISCFYVCLSAAGILIPIIVLSVVTALLFVAFYMDRGFKPLLGAQVTLTAVTSSSLMSMECYMSAWVWGYMSLVLAGAAVITLLRQSNAARLENSSLGRFDALADLEDEFNVRIVILDAQRVRALAYRSTVYLSVGLLERLDDDQLRAVVAHETYHLQTSPSKPLSALLALTSLTFLRYSDEHSADVYAAHVAGVDAIVGALDSLNIEGREDRAARLRQVL
jgi:heat shock protein HtpX